jgi:Tfp pilus assembly protein PilV
MKKPSSNRSGFTLPEVVITGFITVLMMIPISRIAFTTMVSTRYARDLGSALSVGQAQMEQFSDVDYATLGNGTATDDGYELAWTVTTSNNAKIVILTVSWQILGRDQQLNLNSIYTRTTEPRFNFGL